MKQVEEVSAQPVERTDTLTFLRKILPSRGHYFVATLQPGKERPWFKHFSCDTREEAAARATALDAACENVYYACSSYREPFILQTDPKTGEEKKRVRVQDNVLMVRSFWLDLDVKNEPSAYATQEDAIAGLAAFLKESLLPVPLIVSSGNGLHCYWPLTEDILPPQWLVAARLLKSLATKLGLKQDPSRTSDHASVLRPVGTYNRKDPQSPKPVELVRDANAISFGDFFQALESACRTQGVDTPAAPAGAVTSDINAKFAIEPCYPDSHASLIADRCPQIRAMRDTGGNVPEPVWYGAIQVLRCTVEGRDVIHAWSSGYEGYSPDETDKKIAQVEGMGPLTCDKFEERNPAGCVGCPYKGKISSPIQLGWDVDTAPIGITLGSPSPESRSVETFRDTLTCGPNSGALNHAALLQNMNTKFAWVEGPQSIFRFKHQDFIEPSKFKTETANLPRVVVPHGNTSRTMTAADFWLSSPSRRQYADVVYAPGKAAEVDDRLNLWTGWGCGAVEGDIAPWCRVLSHMFSGDANGQRWFEQWLAFPIRFPGTKLSTAVILHSREQGIGKSLIGETVRLIYGTGNSTVITSDALNSKFNGWARNNQFVLGEEATSTDKRASAGVLKHYITSDRVRVEEKFQPPLELDNVMNLLFTSNRPNAFHLDARDRRFYVKELTCGRLPADVYRRFVKWRDHEGGKQALRHHFEHLDMTGFDPKAEAPYNNSKDDMIELGRSDLERWCLENAVDGDQVPELISAGELVAHYRSATGNAATTTAIGNALRNLGVNTKNRIVTPQSKSGADRRMVWAVRHGAYWAAQPAEEWSKGYDAQRRVPSNLRLAHAA